MKAQASSSTTRLRIPVRLAALSILSILLASGCGNNDESGLSGTNGNGTGATGGDGTAPFTGAALCTAVAGPNGFSGFVRLVPDEELEARQQIDSTAGAIEVTGGATCAVRGRSIFALSWESPIITRYDEVDGALVEVGRVSFANFGLESLQSDFRQVLFLTDTKAYFVNAPSSEIIAWNPGAMETIGSFSLSVAEPPEGLTPRVTRAHLIDELLMVYNSYSTELDASAARADFWWIDTETDEVVATDTTEQCGDLPATVATATNGDVYIGSGGASAMEHALGLPESFPPCAIRVRAGTREIDTTYLANLNPLTGGLPTGGAWPVGNDRAFLVAFDTSAMEIDPMLTAAELTNLSNWNYYEWTLGTGQPATLVESIATGLAATDVREFGGRSFLVRLGADAQGNPQTSLLDLTERPVVTAYTLSNFIINLARLGSEPDARMAQRIEPPSGRSVRPF